MVGGCSRISSPLRSILCVSPCKQVWEACIISIKHFYFIDSTELSCSGVMWVVAVEEAVAVARVVAAAAVIAARLSAKVKLCMPAVTSFHKLIPLQNYKAIQFELTKCSFPANCPRHGRKLPPHIAAELRGRRSKHCSVTRAPSKRGRQA